MKHSDLFIFIDLLWKKYVQSSYFIINLYKFFKKWSYVKLMTKRRENKLAPFSIVVLSDSLLYLMSNVYYNFKNENWWLQSPVNPRHMMGFTCSFINPHLSPTFCFVLHLTGNNRFFFPTETSLIVSTSPRA